MASDATASLLECVPSVVAGQVWKRPGKYAVVVRVYCDADWPDDLIPARILVDIVEIDIGEGFLGSRTVSTDELRADHALVYDATLKEPFDVR